MFLEQVRTGREGSLRPTVDILVDTKQNIKRISLEADIRPIVFIRETISVLYNKSYVRQYP